MVSERNGAARILHEQSLRDLTACDIAEVERILGVDFSKDGKRRLNRVLAHHSLYQGGVRGWLRDLELWGDGILAIAIRMLRFRLWSAQPKSARYAYTIMISNRFWSRKLGAIGLLPFIQVREGSMDHYPVFAPKGCADIMEALFALVAYESNNVQQAIDMIHRLIQPELDLPLHQLVEIFRNCPDAHGDMTLCGAGSGNGNGFAVSLPQGFEIPEKLRPVIESARKRGTTALVEIFHRRGASQIQHRRRESAREVLDRALQEIGLLTARVRAIPKGKRIEVQIDTGGWILAANFGRSPRRVQREATIAAVEELRRVLIPEGVEI